MLKNSRIKGILGEWISIVYLYAKGYRPLALNDKSMGIEGDIVFSHKDFIVLVEVKWRKTIEKGHYAVHPHQQKRLIRKLQSLSSKYPNKSLRIDLVLICPTAPFIAHIENAFSL